MKKIVIALLTIIVIGEIIFRIFYSVAILPVWNGIWGEIWQLLSNNIDIYYEGTGHSNETGVRNFPPDAFNIRERLNHDTHHIVTWLGFSYDNITINCKEIREEMLVFLHPINAPKWWPSKLQKTLFPRDRSEYKFYCCNDNNTFFNAISIEFYAIDNKSKIGYYWNMPSYYIKPKDLKKYL